MCSCARARIVLLLTIYFSCVAHGMCTSTGKPQRGIKIVRTRCAAATARCPRNVCICLRLVCVCIRHRVPGAWAGAGAHAGLISLLVHCQCLWQALPLHPEARLTLWLVAGEEKTGTGA